MKTSIFLSWKYWKTHKKRAFSLAIAIVIGIASVVCMSFISRGLVVKKIEVQLDKYGNYDSAITNVTTEQESLLLSQADSKYLSYGFICNVGNAILESSELTFPIYYYDNDTAMELYHLSLITGNYPTASGEITISQDYANALGIVPEVGTKITINFNDLNDNSLSNTYTIVGILSNSQNFRSLDVPSPEIFVYKNDFLDFKTSKVFLEQEDYSNSDFYLWTLINYSYDEQITNNIDNTPENASIYKSMDICYGDRQSIYMTILGGRDYSSDYDNKNMVTERIESNNVDGDFNSTVLIPIFSAIILILMVVSIYSSVNISMEERIKQFGMLRCIGISAKQSTLMMIIETGLISIVSFVVGIALGVGIYVLINITLKNVFEIPVYWAFSVNEVVSAVTINPYVYSISVGMVSIAIAVVVPSIKMLRLTPLQAYYNGTPKGLHSTKLRKKSAIGLLNSKLKNSSGFLITISFMLSMSSCVFGVLYFSSFSDNQVAKYQNKIADEGLYNCDYILKKDFNQAIATDVINQHTWGVLPEDVELICQNSNVENVNLMMIEPNTRISFENMEQNQVYDKALYRSNIEVLNTTKKFQPYNDDIKIAEGYNQNENVYNVPTVGLTDDEILSLKEYVVSGSIDTNALKNGSQVVWVTLSKEVGEYLGISYLNENPYQVGDVLSLSNIYLNEYDDYDFSNGIPDIMLDNPIVTFEEDGEPYKIYSIGAINTITRYSATIGAIIEITDTDVAKQYFCMDSWGYCSFNIICDYNAYSNWGFSFNRFTNVGISLKNPHDKEFITLLNKISSSSSGLELLSASDLKTSIYSENISIMSSCIAILILILLISVINIWNCFSYSIRKHSEKIAILQALGMSIKDIRKMVLLRNIKYPLISIPFTLFPLVIFQLAYNRACNILHSIESLSIEDKYTMNGWYNSFPLYIDLIEQPFLKVIVSTIIVAILITVLISIISLNSAKSTSIVENIRRGDI